ncbi:YwbE family protein [Polaribacter glomeratus]|uniref:YwbE family protein n=1 Tax=Polaribacter glomeratus TaxID=102 RepID=UPI0011BECE7E|nr:YwbE family protein [Polaribacter glomeratus]TXD66512.1 YwbE family protein [Polaribacter glomeratus]
MLLKQSSCILFYSTTFCIEPELTQGIVAKILTKSVTHPHGIKVQLESGLVGRVKNIIE